MKIKIKRAKIACDENICFILPVHFSIKKPHSIISPPHDICQTEDLLYIIISLPGVDSSSIDLIFDNNKIIISGNIPFPLTESYLIFNHKENSYGNFEKIISLPCPIDSESIEATLKDGLLVIKASKIKNKNSIKIPITT